jgi:hypothetical protein
MPRRSLTLGSQDLPLSRPLRISSPLQLNVAAACHAAALSTAVLSSLLLLLAPPAFAEWDEFQLPPGIEQTRIPRRLPSSGRLAPRVDPALIAEIDRTRAAIERLYARGDYEAAEPLYAQYVDLVGRAAPGDVRLAYALQNYGELLQKLHRYGDAAKIDSRAQTLFVENNIKEQPFALKQYQLGMTLDEFTKMSPPGLTDKVKTVCSCDQGQTEEVVSQDEILAKVVNCGFWLNPEKAPAGKSGIRKPYKMTVGSIECRPDFRFIEADGGYRLFDISLTFFASHYDEMRQALVAKYGPPKDETVENMRTEMGNNFRLTNLIWDNGVSRIRLSNADGTNVGIAKLVYSHRQLFLSYAQRLNEHRQIPAKRAEKDL